MSLPALGQIILAVVLWFVAIWGLLLRMEPFAGWLYHFMWWPLILFLDGVLWRLSGRSRIWGDPGEFLRLAVFSVTAWLIFEAFNLYLLNWRYVGLEPRLWLRWPGYALAFATVTPGILLTADLLGVLGVGAGLRGRPRSLPGWRAASFLVGLACLILPFLAPRFAFPLIWLAFLFLLDPILDLLTGDSLTRRFLAGERQRHLDLLLAGLFCGVWWELWNYPARAKWIYTLPVLQFGKIFEMPFLGYLGFLPFALECALLYALFELMDRRLRGSPRRRLFFLAQGAFWLVMFWALDAYTVISFRSNGP